MKINLESYKSLSVVALLAANAVPLLGVIFLGWDVFSVVLLFWAENLAIGFYNILKIAFVNVERPKEHLGKLFTIPFFLIHFGGFTAGHGLFLLMIFGKGAEDPLAGQPWPCFLIFVQLLFNVIRQVFAVIPGEIKFAILALFASHGVSWVYNYLFRGERENETVSSLMVKPYGRVMVMHITIIIGGFLTMSTGAPLGVLAVLILLKSFIDLQFHLREHKSKTASS
jgi:hypothetical protein